MEGQLLFEEMRYFTFSFPREKRTRRDTLYNINLLSHLFTPCHIFRFTKIKVIYTFPTWDITHPAFHLQNLKYPWKNKQICIKGSVWRWSWQRLRDRALPIAQGGSGDNRRVLGNGGFFRLYLRETTEVTKLQLMYILFNIHYVVLNYSLETQLILCNSSICNDHIRRGNLLFNFCQLLQLHWNRRFTLVMTFIANSSSL